MKATEVVPVVPSSCDIHIETEVIDLLNAMRRKRSPRKERVFNDYMMVKEHFGKRPSYRHVHLHGNENSKEYRQAFGGYFAFLHEYGELNEHEEQIYEKHYEWLTKVEREQMTKSYKMVVLQYLLNKGSDKWYEPVTPQEVAPYFHEFYMSKEYRKRIDFSNRNTKRL